MPMPTLDMPSGEPETAARRSPAVGIVLGVGFAILAVLGFVFLRGGTPPAPPGLVALDVRPWATFEVVDLASNTPVALPVRETPCRISLPPGKYEVRFRNDRFGQHTEAISVESGKLQTIDKSLPSFNLAPVLEKL